MRTFGLILLAFASGVMILVAAFSWQGRAAREYGREAARAMEQTNPSPSASYLVTCTELVKRPAPKDVERCEVDVMNGQAVARVQLEGGRTFEVEP